MTNKIQNFIISHNVFSRMCFISILVYPVILSFVNIKIMFYNYSIFSSTIHHDLDTEEEDRIDTSCWPFLLRVLRTALPLQILLLLLLAIACLVPMSEEDYSCTLANNFRRSLDPMLHYTDGPPPV